MACTAARCTAARCLLLLALLSPSLAWTRSLAQEADGMAAAADAAPAVPPNSSGEPDAAAPLPLSYGGAGVQPPEATTEPVSGGVQLSEEAAEPTGLAVAPLAYGVSHSSWICKCGAAGTGCKAWPAQAICYPPSSGSGFNRAACQSACPSAQSTCSCPPDNTPAQNCPYDRVAAQTSTIDGADLDSQCSILAGDATTFQPEKIPNYCLPRLNTGCKSLYNRPCFSCYLFHQITFGAGSTTNLDDVFGAPRCKLTPGAKKLLKDGCSGSNYPAWDGSAAAVDSAWYVDDAKSPPAAPSTKGIGAKMMQVPADSSVVPLPVDKVIVADLAGSSSGASWTSNPRWKLMPSEEITGMEAACDGEKFVRFAHFYKDAYALAVGAKLPVLTDKTKLPQGFTIKHTELGIMANLPIERTQHQLHVHIGKLFSANEGPTDAKGKVVNWAALVKDAADVAAKPAGTSGLVRSGGWTRLTGRFRAGNIDLVVPVQAAVNGKFEWDDCNDPTKQPGNKRVACEAWVRPVDDLKDALLRFVAFTRTTRSGDFTDPGFGNTCDRTRGVPNNPQFNRYSRTLLVTGHPTANTFLLFVLIRSDASGNPLDDITRLNDYVVLCHADKC